MAPGTRGLGNLRDAPFPGSARVHGSGHLLTRDVPQLQAHQRPAVPVEDLEGEVHPDGGPVVLGEELVDVAFDDAGLAHAELADDQHLKKVLAGLGHGGRRRHRIPARVPGSAARHERPQPGSGRLVWDALQPRAGTPRAVKTFPGLRPRHRLIGHRTRNRPPLADRAGRGKGRGLVRAPGSPPGAPCTSSRGASPPGRGGAPPGRPLVAAREPSIPRLTGRALGSPGGSKSA